ncbi:ribosomal RNA processing protein 1 homolog A isoform X2 [Amia ocellicauda]|uniref:ribosomal RNA processing protein 1 homolog A isoform X2 n=1 Tax=Amia ocellicauda TaxID=2972642 RepID=UPI0034639618
MLTAYWKMAPMLQQPEVQFAQRLASNEKPIRTRAIKKLRKYLSIRTQKDKGAFTNDELLKIWKGLFYCMWMQDKPLLQEELSAVISNLIHALQNVDTQFVYLETFLQTMNREWTGIDRLRLDKFYMLVRMVLRQAFEMLKRRAWEPSLVQRFTELLTAQILRSTSGCPSGIQFHVLDIYMAELATVGSQELSAEQNLTFIDPFCKMAAKTKDHLLLQAISGSIFNEIVDQAPFAIEDLMKELNQKGNDLDFEEVEHLDLSSTSKKIKGPRVNGNKNEKDYESEDEESDLEDGFEPQDDSDGIGPVLQFDYKSIANRLFELASRTNAPHLNRKRIYRLVKKFQDLSEGVFPQDEYPEEVSTDEDDDEMFGSRKRLKRRRNEVVVMDNTEKGKGKGKKKTAVKTSMLQEQNESMLQDMEPIEATNTLTKKKRKKKGRRKSEMDKNTLLKSPVVSKEPGPVGFTESKLVHAQPLVQKANKKKKRKLEQAGPEDYVCDVTGQTGNGEKQNTEKLKKVKMQECLQTQEEYKQQGVPEELTSSEIKRTQKKQRQMIQTAMESTQVHISTDHRGAEDMVPFTSATAEQEEMSQVKSKKKRKLVETEPSNLNGHRGSKGKKNKKIIDSPSILISGNAKKSLKNPKSKPETDFVKFETPSIPAPLFFRKAKGSPCTAVKKTQGFQTPKSESKKVTFGLKNNKTSSKKQTKAF